MDIGSEMLNYFESNLGRIEILGSSNKIERIYFNIQSSSLDQWEAPQIRESKRQFIFDVVVDDGGEKGKMEEFVNFCEVSSYIRHNLWVNKLWLTRTIRGRVRDF